MKLSARQKYDYRDLDRGEAQLIRVGHALWRDRRKLGDTVAEREGINVLLDFGLKGREQFSPRHVFAQGRRREFKYTRQLMLGHPLCLWTQKRQPE